MYPLLCVTVLGMTELENETHKEVQIMLALVKVY